MKPASNDKSIIDVTGQSADLNNMVTLQKYDSGVPLWEKKYIFSFSEIYAANEAQKQFFEIYRNRFLKGTYLDLEGNTNYAFILMFDLLKNYDLHRDYVKSKSLLELLGHYYPLTKNYGVFNLKTKIEALKKIQKSPEPSEQEKYELQYDYGGWNDWRLGSIYMEKFDLNKEKLILLNRINYTRNNFNSIEFCRTEIVKLFLSVIDVLEKMYALEQTTFEQEIEFLAELISVKVFKHKIWTTEFRFCNRSITNELYTVIFRYCENEVRETSDQIRKLSTHTEYKQAEVNEELEQRLFSYIKKILPKFKSSISLPDEEAETELNILSESRWKTKFKKIKNSYADNSEEFGSEIFNLVLLNKSNPDRPNIYYEASEFIAKHDRVDALKLYLYYVLETTKQLYSRQQKLSKRIIKLIFKNQEQQKDFQILVDTLLQDRDLETILAKVPAIFQPKRKTIELSQNTIDNVHQQHEGTVSLLSEYLKEAEEDTEDKGEQHLSKENKQEILETQMFISKPNSIFVPSIEFTSIHIELIQLFKENDFIVTTKQAKSFAKSKRLFHNQLIEKVNEICFEHLDDVLIEEGETHFSMDQNYYNSLLAK